VCEWYLAFYCSGWKRPESEILAFFGGPDWGIFDQDWLKRRLAAGKRIAVQLCLADASADNHTLAAN